MWCNIYFRNLLHHTYTTGHLLRLQVRGSDGRPHTIALSGSKQNGAQHIAQILNPKYIMFDTNQLGTAYISRYLVPSTGQHRDCILLKAECVPVWSTSLASICKQRQKYLLFYRSNITDILLKMIHRKLHKHKHTEFTQLSSLNHQWPITAGHPLLQAPQHRSPITILNLNTALKHTEDVNK